MTEGTLRVRVVSSTVSLLLAGCNTWSKSHVTLALPVKSRAMRCLRVLRVQSVFPGSTWPSFPASSRVEHNPGLRSCPYFTSWCPGPGRTSSVASRKSSTWDLQVTPFWKETDSSCGQCPAYQQREATAPTQGTTGMQAPPAGKGRGGPLEYQLRQEPRH